MGDKIVIIETLFTFDAAQDYLYYTMDEFIEQGHKHIKGEIELIDGQWRVGIITDNRQLELEV